MCDASGETRPAADFAQSMRGHLERVERHNARQLEQVAGRILQCIADDGIVLTAGAGHSLGAVSETFYRAGGLACIRPLYIPALWPLNGAQASTQAERQPGLASSFLQSSDVTEHDVFIIFSNSGANPYPVELAQQARHEWCHVVAVTSRTAMSAAPQRTDTKLADHADYVLDTLVPAGDAAYPPGRPITGPLSSVTNIYLWNILLADLIDRAERTGAELPLWQSANVPGTDQANERLMTHYAPRIPELRTE